MESQKNCHATPCESNPSAESANLTFGYSKRWTFSDTLATSKKISVKDLHIIFLCSSFVVIILVLGFDWPMGSSLSDIQSNLSKTYLIIFLHFHFKSTLLFGSCLFEINDDKVQIFSKFIKFTFYKLIFRMKQIKANVP